MKREETPYWWRDPLVLDALATGGLVAVISILVLAGALAAIAP